MAEEELRSKGNIIPEERSIDEDGTVQASAEVDASRAIHVDNTHERAFPNDLGPYNAVFSIDDAGTFPQRHGQGYILL
jgi:hypothetical protein